MTGASTCGSGGWVKVIELELEVICTIDVARTVDVEEADYVANIDEAVMAFGADTSRVLDSIGGFNNFSRRKTLRRATLFLLILLENCEQSWQASVL